MGSRGHRKRSHASLRTRRRPICLGTAGHATRSRGKTRSPGSSSTDRWRSSDTRRAGEVRRSLGAASHARIAASVRGAVATRAAGAPRRRAGQRPPAPRCGRATQLLGRAWRPARPGPADLRGPRREVLRPLEADARHASSRRTDLHPRLRPRAPRRATPGFRGGTAMKWNLVQKYEDVIYEKSDHGIAKITIDRPQVRNALRPQTLFELEKC